MTVTKLHFSAGQTGWSCSSSLSCFLKWILFFLDTALSSGVIVTICPQTTTWQLYNDSSDSLSLTQKTLYGLTSSSICAPPQPIDVTFLRCIISTFDLISYRVLSLSGTRRVALNLSIIIIMWLILSHINALVFTLTYYKTLAFFFFCNVPGGFFFCWMMLSSLSFHLMQLNTRNVVFFFIPCVQITLMSQDIWDLQHVGQPPCCSD